MRTATKILQTTGMIASLAAAAAMALAMGATTCLAESATKPAAPNTFVSKKDGFSLAVPATWDKLENQPGIAVFFLEPQEDTSDAFRENVNVVVEALPAGMNLDAYAAATLKALPTMLKEFKLVSSQKVKLGKLTAQRILMRHKSGIYDFKGLCYVVVSGGRGYSLTCTAPVDKYPSHEKEFENICKTFQAFEANSAQAGLFTSEKDGFSITGPNTWDMRESLMGMTVVFLEPLANKSDTFHENVNVVVEMLPAGMDLDGYVKANLAGVAKALKGFKVVSSASAKIGKNTAQRMVYQHNTTGTNLKVLLYVVVSGGRGYVITCTSTPDQYPSHERIFEDICKTFETAASPVKAGAKESTKDGTKMSPSSL